MLYISGLKTLLARCSWLFRHPHLQRDAAEFLALPHTQTGERKACKTPSRRSRKIWTF